MAILIARHVVPDDSRLALADEYFRRDWLAFDQRVNRLIRALRAAGLKAGDTMALFAGNSVATFELMTAAHHSGLRYVPVNWHFSADELEHVMRDAQAVALFTDTTYRATAAQVLARVGNSCRLAICARWPADEGVPDDPAFIDFERWIESQPDASEPVDQVAGGPMFYTSGTTGRPKGVVRTGSRAPTLPALGAAADAFGEQARLPAGGTALLAGPYYHSAQWAFAFQPMLAGRGVVSTRRFDPAQTLAVIDQHQVTHTHLVPTQFIRLLRLPQDTRDSFDGRSLQRVWHGAAPCSPEIKRQMIEWWGPCIDEYYGSTEGSVVTGITSEEWLQRPNSVGRATFLTDVAIHREDGTPAPSGEQGTIYMRNRRGLSLKYHNDPEKTAAAHHGDQWFTTGDVGWLDDDGYLYLTDRKIDMIISGGVNIYPAEIEAVLSAHPSVHDVAVIGVPNEEFGEEVKAIVQPVAGCVPGPSLQDELVAACRQKLAGYKVPRSFEFRDQLPRTETGKLQKRLLRDAYWQGAKRRI